MIASLSPLYSHKGGQNFSSLYNQSQHTINGMYVPATENTPQIIKNTVCVFTPC